MKWLIHLKANIALRISLGYFIGAMSWILFSDRVLEWLSPTYEDLAQIQTLKGIAFVTLTATLLFYLINRYQVLALRYNSLSRFANDTILLTDDQGYIVDINDKGETTYGYTREYMIGQHIDLIRHDPTNSWASQYRESEAELRLHGLIYESIHRRSDGTSFPVEVSAAFIGLGNRPLIQAIIRDLTERQAAERELRHNQEMLSEMSTIAKIGGWRFDCSIMRGSWTPEIARIHEVEDTNVPVEYGLSFFEAESRKKIEASLNAAIKDGIPYDLELEMITARNNRKWVRTVGHPRMEHGKVVQVYGSMQDITEKKLSEEKMLLASQVFENSSEAIFIADTDNELLSVNPAFTHLTGYAADEVLSKNPRHFAFAMQTDEFLEEIESQLAAHGHWQGEVWNRRKNGEVFAEWLTINTILDAEGNVFRRVALFSDITENKQNQELIWLQANFDTLTGLPNRRMLHDRLEQEIRKAERTQQLMAVLFIDLDRFKEINDSLGHSMGDILLKEAANRLSACVRETDTVARLGGDEFVILLTALTDNVGIQRTASAILRQFDQAFKLGTETAHVSASMGITIFPNDALTADDLLKNADQAMYCAKSNGRNRFFYYTSSMQELAQKRMRLSSDLHNALAANQFTLHYQPIIELTTGTAVKAEALIRWEHPERGLISPDTFIPVAEDTGMIVEIGDWVFRQAATQVKKIQRLHPGFQISINKSPIQFRAEQESHDGWVDHLKHNGLPRQSIVIEITEGLLMETQASVTDQLLHFRDAGIQVALDDFGTGYSSLAYLKKFDIDFLKIDRVFISNLASSASDMALCEAIIVMAHKLDIKVIAEGIETEEQMELLKKMGCDYGQGYYFSRPVAPAEFEQFLRNNRASTVAADKKIPAIGEE